MAQQESNRLITTKELNSNKRAVKSFTLLELLIVIGILAVLASVTFIALNPAEQLKKSRDSARLSDIQSINRALGYYETEKGSITGSSSVVYLSLPDNDNTLPEDCDEYTLPSLPSGWSYHCALKSNFRKIDGTGWIPVNFASMNIGSPFSALPVDPLNNQNYYYTYVTGGSWALSSLLESQRLLQEQAAKDGGYNPGKFEAGTNLQLIAQSEGLVGYWSFDEGTGTTAKDYSGNNNNGTLINGPLWVDGKVGKALSFPGDFDRVEITNWLNIGNQSASFLVWVKLSPSDLNMNTSEFLNTLGGRGSPCYDALYFSYRGLTTKRWQVQFNTSDGVNCDGSSVVSDNVFADTDTWVHLAGILNRDINKINLFINGTKQSGNPSVSYSIQSNGLRISQINPSYRNFNGAIDEVIVYKRALSEAEIKAIYNATK